MSNVVEQLVLEEKFSKRHLIKVLANEISNEVFNPIYTKLANKVNIYLSGDYWESKQDYITAICMMDITVMDIVDNIILTTLRFKETNIQNVANTLGSMFSGIDSAFIQVQIGADLLDICKNVIYTLTKVENTVMFKSLIDLDKQLQSDVDLGMYLPPMVTEPLPIRNNYQSGYLLHNDSVILGNKEADHSKYINLSTINVLNKVGFTLDRETVIYEKEKPKKELEGQDLENHMQYMIEKRALLRMYKGKKFFFNHKFDSRGRVYCQGYHLSYQSTEYNKSLISFAKHEVVELT